MVETMLITYPVTAITNTSTTATINSDFDLEDYAATTERPQITFPFAKEFDLLLTILFYYLM
jgi:hypothetical protein